ncbi:cadherin domain protein [Cooperia oncophora]
MSELQVIYSMKIMENSDPKQHLCVHATDRDQGDNANISYSITRGERVGSPVLIISASDPDGSGNHTFSIDNETTTPFSIDPHTGQIYLRQPLDREKANQTLGRVLAKDADEGENGIVHYRVHRDVPYTSIDTVTGELKLLALPEKGITKITVTAQDNGVPAMFSSVHVVLVRATEHQGTCELAVNKDTRIGTKLGNIEEYCTFMTGRKAIRRFFSDESLLTINSEGEVITSGEVHKDADVRLICELEDGEATVHPVRLELSQGNANSPHFESKIFRFAVPEDAEYGDAVGVTYAKDSDAGLAGKLRYHIDAPDLPFHILSNGTLVVSGPLDYEAQRRYVFNVTATDQGQPPRNATTQVVIDLLDIDDNPPVIESAELTYAVTTIDETICPSVMDVDTPLNDLQYFVSTPLDTITTDNCISIPSDVPPVIDWTVSDKSQSITVKVVLIDMIPKDTNIQDENVTISESAMAGTIVSSYATEIFAERNDQLSIDAKDVRVTGDRGTSDNQMIIYAKSKVWTSSEKRVGSEGVAVCGRVAVFGVFVGSEGVAVCGRVAVFGVFNLCLPSDCSKLQVAASQIAPAPVFSNTAYAFNISENTPIDTVIHDFSMSVPTDCLLAIVDGDSEKVR